MDIFCDCKNIDDAKALYRKLSKLYHPDTGGDKDLMMDLTKQYECFCGGQRTQRPSSSGGYEFNTINRNKGFGYGAAASVNIPFDHPIQQELRELRNTNAYLSAENIVKAAECRRLEKLGYELHDIIFKERQMNRTLQQQINNTPDVSQYGFFGRAYYLFTGELPDD